MLMKFFYTYANNKYPFKAFLFLFLIPIFMMTVMLFTVCVTFSLTFMS